jgi:hypothetical protein
MQLSCLLRPQRKHFNFAVVVIPARKFVSYEQLDILNAIYDLFFHFTPRCESRDNIKIVAILNSSCVRYRIRPMISQRRNPSVHPTPLVLLFLLSTTRVSLKISGHLACCVLKENISLSVSRMEIQDTYENIVIKTLGYGCQIRFLTSFR